MNYLLRGLNADVWEKFKTILPSGVLLSDTFRAFIDSVISGEIKIDKSYNIKFSNEELKKVIRKNNDLVKQIQKFSNTLNSFCYKYEHRR